HGGEGLLGEALHQLGFASVHVHHAGGYAYRLEPGAGQQWVQLPPDVGIAACGTLQVDEALDGPPGHVAIGMEEGRAVISLDDGDGASWFQHLPECLEHAGRLGQMLENEAEEDVVERTGLEGKREDV